MKDWLCHNWFSGSRTKSNLVKLNTDKTQNNRSWKWSLVNYPFGWPDVQVVRRSNWVIDGYIYLCFSFGLSPCQVFLILSVKGRKTTPEPAAQQLRDVSMVKSRGGFLGAEHSGCCKWKTHCGGSPYTARWAWCEGLSVWALGDHPAEPLFSAEVLCVVTVSLPFPWLLWSTANAQLMEWTWNTGVLCCCFWHRWWYQAYMGISTAVLLEW